MTFSGSTVGVAYTGVPCVDTTGSFTLVLSGAAEYDDDTCELISQGTQTTTINGGTPSVVSLSGPTVPQDESCLSGVEVTRTSVARVTAPNCCATGPGQAQIHTTSNRREDLSVEDTEEDAIARAVAGGWSEWSPVDEFCQNPGCCQSAYEERVSGFGFVYIEAEFKVKKTGLTPGQAYDIAVDLYRRPYDSGPYELYATIELSATVDGSGILETNATAVPNDLGFQTYASSPARLTPVP